MSKKAKRCEECKYAIVLRRELWCELKHWPRYYRKEGAWKRRCDDFEKREERER